MKAISLVDVSKSYGDISAVSNLNMEVESGEVLCLLGPNGAGKSTTLNLMLGLIRPDRGNLEIFGNKPTSTAARRLTGYVAQDNDFPENLTAREVIELVKSHYPKPGLTDELIDVFGLAQLAERYTGGYSGGERRRLALALAFAGNVKLVFLDEPTTGLDSTSRKKFWEYSKEYLKSGGTLVVTTHHLEEVENIASRVCLIDRGIIHLEGDIEEIKKRLGQKVLTFACEDLPPLSPTTYSTSKDGLHTVASPNADEIVHQLVNSGVAFSNLEIGRLSLERVIEIILENKKSNS